MRDRSGDDYSIAECLYCRKVKELVEMEYVRAPEMRDGLDGRCLDCKARGKGRHSYNGRWYKGSVAAALIVLLAVPVLAGRLRKQTEVVYFTTDSCSDGQIHPAAFLAGVTVLFAPVSDGECVSTLKPDDPADRLFGCCSGAVPLCSLPAVVSTPPHPTCAGEPRSLGGYVAQVPGDYRP